MDLTTLKDTFARAGKKQKVSSNKTRESIDRLKQAIEQALTDLRSANDGNGSSHVMSILTDLNGKMNDLAATKIISGSQKEPGIELNRYVKIVEKEFNPEISKSYRNTDWDVNTVNGIIACHLYREGLFEVADCFIGEAHVPDVATIRSLYMDMHQILEAMRSRDLKPALNWAALQHERLVQNGSTLELKLHSLQFLEKIKRGERNEALDYAKTFLAPFASTCKHEIQKLMACLLWAGRLSESPYQEFLSLNRWEKLTEELTQQFCNLMGQSSRGPLSVVVGAGALALPTLLKMANVAAVTSRNWQEMKQLPSSVDLPDDLQFHSIFVCPVSWERASEENPPMMLPCGHVLCKQAIVKMAKGSTRHFKCPLCPDEATLAQCRQLHF